MYSKSWWDLTRLKEYISEIHLVAQVLLHELAPGPHGQMMGHAPGGAVVLHDHARQFPGPVDDLVALDDLVDGAQLEAGLRVDALGGKAR